MDAAKFFKAINAEEVSAFALLRILDDIVFVAMLIDNTELLEKLIEFYNKYIFEDMEIVTAHGTLESFIKYRQRHMRSLSLNSSSLSLNTVNAYINRLRNVKYGLQYFYTQSQQCMRYLDNVRKTKDAVEFYCQSLEQIRQQLNNVQPFMQTNLMNVCLYMYVIPRYKGPDPITQADNIQYNVVYKDTHNNMLHYSTEDPIWTELRNFINVYWNILALIYNRLATYSDQYNLQVQIEPDDASIVAKRSFGEIVLDANRHTLFEISHKDKQSKHRLIMFYASYVHEIGKIMGVQLFPSLS